MQTEVLFLGRNNTIDLLLKADGVAQDLSSVTKITATIGSDLLTSTNATAGVIRWSGDGFDTGEIRIVSGAESLAAGKYDVPIVVYDAANTSGIDWGIVPIEVKADREAS